MLVIRAGTGDARIGERTIGVVALRATSSRPQRCQGMRRLCAGLIIVVAVLGPGLASVAFAAEPWTSPSPMRYGATIAALRGPTQVAANSAGLAVAIADGGGSGEVGPHTYASVFSNGVFLDPYRLSRANLAYGPYSGRIATYARSRLLAVGVQRAPDSAQVVVALGRLTPNRASLGAPRALGPAGMHAGGGALAVNDAGDAAIVYPVCRDAGCRRALVYLAVRRRGTSTISSTRLYDGGGGLLPRVAAAINARGDALAVWTTAGGVRARVRTLGGSLRATQRVGAIAPRTEPAPSAALSTDRVELIGWLSQTLIEGDGGPGSTYAAQARDGAPFSTPVKLADIPAQTGGMFLGSVAVRVAFDRLGRRLVAWTGYEQGRFVVRSAQLQAAADSDRSELTDAVLISDPAADTILTDLEVTPTGQQVATLLSGIRTSQPVAGSAGVEVALRGSAAAGPFVREAVSDANAGAIAADSAIAATDRVITTWTMFGGDFYSLRSGRLP